MAAGCGWVGTILRVNLTEGVVLREPLAMGDARDYVGARGLGVKYLCDEVDPKVDPLSPENKLIFMTGPLTGTTAPSGGRFEVVSKAPLTGAIGTANSGGRFGPELKYAGYDGVIIEGRAETPVYLFIDDRRVEIRDASHLWGKNAHATTDLLEEECGDIRVACIASPGERGILFSGIVNDRNRAAGRGGLGAVMGSKNLKAIAVRGTGNVKVADAKAFQREALRARSIVQAHPVPDTGLAALGTGYLTNRTGETDGSPIYRIRKGSVFDRVAELKGEEAASRYLVGNTSCFGCPIACGRITRVPDDSPYASLGEGPEYQSGLSFGATCGVDNLGAIIRANHICNEEGIDPISLSSAIGCAMELARMGCIPESDIGFPLRFGDPDAMVRLTRMCADGEGFGEVIGLGSYRMAEKYGHPEVVVGKDWQDPPIYSGHVIEGIGLEYLTSGREIGWTLDYRISPESLDVAVVSDQVKADDKTGARSGGAILKTYQDLTALCDSMGICLFTTYSIGLPEIAGQYRAAVGSDESDEDILLKGERIWNLEKRFNIAAGVEKGVHPPRLLREELASGPSKGKIKELQITSARYYESRGWTDEEV